MNNQNTRIVNCMQSEDPREFKILALAISQMKRDSENNGIYSCSKKVIFNQLKVDEEYLQGLVDRRIAGPCIYYWMLAFCNQENRMIEEHQMVTDAVYKDNELTFRFNNGLRDYLDNYQKFYSDNIESILACEGSYEAYLSVKY